MNIVRLTSINLVNQGKLNKAIARLENLCSFEGQQIIDCLSEYDGLPYIDILIQTGLDEDVLQHQLKKLEKGQFITVEDNYYSKEYFLNEEKLATISMLASILAKR